MKPVVAITGGTGFVGRRVMAIFSNAGWRLRVLVRGAPRFDIGNEPIELIPGDLSEPQALKKLVKGADAVVHMAGAIKARNRSGFMAVNSTGTSALIAAMEQEAPAAKIVVLSSLAAREPSLSSYAYSKAEGEKFVSNSPLSSCILRPCAIYGPGDRETLTAFKSARLPVHLLLNDRRARVGLVHVDDVARAILASASPGGPTGLYEVCDMQINGYTWHELTHAICQAMERPHRPLFVSPIIVKFLCCLGDLASQVTGSTHMMTSEKSRELLHLDWGSTAQRQLPETLWKPAYTLKAGLSETVDWYRHNHWL